MKHGRAHLGIHRTGLVAVVRLIAWERCEEVVQKFDMLHPAGSGFGEYFVEPELESLHSVSNEADLLAIRPSLSEGELHPKLQLERVLWWEVPCQLEELRPLQGISQPEKVGVVFEDMPRLMLKADTDGESCPLCLWVAVERNYLDRKRCLARVEVDHLNSGEQCFEGGSDVGRVGRLGSGVGGASRDCPRTCAKRTRPGTCHDPSHVHVGCLGFARVGRSHGYAVIIGVCRTHRWAGSLFVKGIVDHLGGCPLCRPGGGSGAE
mmetsp:Transcript_23791/g.62237  ORF Transcript_23791/g.62237 Transcript_23791/m.62237 type:complete len:264 (+) Transcript_23791:707-1498(+)